MANNILNHVATVPSLEELRNEIRTVEHLSAEFQHKSKRLEKIALWVTQKIGTMGFFLTLFFWTLGWLIWNTFGPLELRFDPFPAFVLWFFIADVIQLFLLPLLLVGQNLQGRKTEKRAEFDYRVNLKAEKEIEAVLLHLEHQQKLIKEILETVKK